MGPLFNVNFLFISNFYAVVAFVAICAAIYLMLGKKERRTKKLVELRKRYEESKPTDPEYNQVRALYVSMIMDAHRLNAIHKADPDNADGSHLFSSGQSSNNGLPAGGASADIGGTVDSGSSGDGTGFGDSGGSIGDR